MDLHGIDTTTALTRGGSRAPLLDVLLSDRLGAEFFGAPVLHRTRYGVRFVAEGRSVLEVEAHRDQCLAFLARNGVPLSYPLFVGAERLTVGDLLNDSLAEFHLRQAELAWTAEAYALYLAPARGWRNRFGERFSFDELVRELLARPVNESSCFGMHLILAATVIHRVNDAKTILSDQVRGSLADRLLALVRACVASQAPDGYWPLDWYGREAPRTARPHRLSPRETDDERLLMAAHVAEWLLILPAELQDAHETKRRAACYLLERLRTADDREQLQKACAYSHAAHALKCWGNRRGSPKQGKLSAPGAAGAARGAPKQSPRRG